MSTVVKDLGAVSAYAYAVEKGYTGTEAEFAELMADYADVGQRAEDAAESVSASAAQIATNTADITDLKEDLNSGDFMTKEGHFTDAEKALNWSTSTRKIKFLSVSEGLLMSFKESEAGTKTVSCALSQMTGFDFTSVQFSTTDYPYVVLRTTSNLPNVAGSKFKFYIYSADGTGGDEVAVNLTNGDNLIVINLPKLIADSGKNASVKTLIEPDGIRTASYTYTDAPSISVYFMGMFSEEDAKSYNLNETVKDLRNDVAEESNEIIKIKESGSYNLIDETVSVFGVIDPDGTISVGNIERKPVVSDFISVDEGQNYTLQLWEKIDGQLWARVVYFGADKSVLNYETILDGFVSDRNFAYYKRKITIPSSVSFIKVGFNSYGVGKAKLEKGVIASDWSDGVGALLNHKAHNSADGYMLKSIVHRGVHQNAPENTVPAYIQAKKDGWYFVETDVSWTKDNVPVLLHDDTLNRTCCNASDGSSIVGDLTVGSLDYSQLADYDACTPSQWETFKGTKIPSFEQFVALCRNIGLHPYIELKTAQSPTIDMIASLVSTVKKYGMERNVTWISFSMTLLRYVRDNCPSARLGILESSYDSRIQVNASMLKTVNNEVFVDAETTIVNDTLVNECISFGVPLEVYCPDTESDMLALNGYVSGATSNFLQFDKVISDSILGD